MQDTGSQNVAFILVRPQFLGNIGSVARSMKNFGFSDLRFVEPPRNYKDAEARKMAVAAFDVLKHSSTFTSLASAIEDVHTVIGTSSGQQRKEALQDLDAAIKTLPMNRDARIGIVFGDEVDGLRKDELSLCHLVARIPTNPQFPSLNLAQAAGIIAYELSRFLHLSHPPPAQPIEQLPPPVGEVDEVFDQLALFLETVDFARDRNKAQVLTELRQFFYRARPTKRENDLLRGVLHKLNHSLPKS